MPAFHRIADDLVNQRPGAATAATASASPLARPDMEIFVAHRDWSACLSSTATDGSMCSENIAEIDWSASRLV